MNYRHLYHAGGFADVVKHAVLALILGRLAEKQAAYCVLDTHAGIGRYDLSQIAAQKTGEYLNGIARLLTAERAPDAVRPYLEAVRGLNPGGQLRWYPGSPAIAAALSRRQDRLALVELHDDDVAELRRTLGRDRRVGIHHADGYAALKSLLPPKERRGVVLIDPPFEAGNEFETLAASLIAAHARWPGGIYVAWYPIKDPAPVRSFHAALKSSGMRKVMIVELLVRRADSAGTLNGCGLVLVNPPWQIEKALDELLPWIADRLKQGPGPRGAWHWLVPE